MLSILKWTDAFESHMAERVITPSREVVNVPFQEQMDRDGVWIGRQVRITVGFLKLRKRSFSNPHGEQRKPGYTDRSLRGRDAGLAESSAGAPAFAGRCRSEEPSLSAALGR